MNRLTRGLKSTEHWFSSVCEEPQSPKLFWEFVRTIQSMSDLSNLPANSDFLRQTNRAFAVSGPSPAVYSNLWTRTSAAQQK